MERDKTQNLTQKKKTFVRVVKHVVFKHEQPKNKEENQTLITISLQVQF